MKNEMEWTTGKKDRKREKRKKESKMWEKNKWNCKATEWEQELK